MHVTSQWAEATWLELRAQKNETDRKQERAFVRLTVEIESSRIQKKEKVKLRKPKREKA